MRISSLANNQFTKELRIQPSTRFFFRKQNEYVVKSPIGQTMASFSFKSDGVIENLKLSKSIRRKKDGLCALFAIKNFITRKARKDNLDYVSFYADDKNPNNVVRMYKRFSVLIEDDSMPYFLLPVSRKGKKIVSDIVNWSTLVFK